MTTPSGTDSYFPYDIQIAEHLWRSLDLGALSAGIRARGIPRIQFYRQLAFRLTNSRPAGAPVVHAAELNLYATLQKSLRYLVDGIARAQATSLLINALADGGLDLAGDDFQLAARRFVELFPPEAVLDGALTPEQWVSNALARQDQLHLLLREMLLLKLAALNPAVASFRELVDDRPLMTTTCYPAIVKAFDRALKDEPLLAGKGGSLFDALLAAIHAAPDSLAAQVAYLHGEWQSLFPPDLLSEGAIALDILREEHMDRGGAGDEPGPAPVLEFRHNTAGSGTAEIFHGVDYPEYEQFSPDADWMSHVVMMAKMVYVWLDQLSRSHGYPITRLDQIPDAELDTLANRGFTGLWLIGLWERSPASQRIKQICGNPEAIASAYSLYDYEIAADLGGWQALANLRERALKRGIRLASDMVPNHTGIYSRWVVQHPDWFVQTDYPPYPTYQFTGEDLSHDEGVRIQVENGYWSRSDAAVVFRHQDRRSGRTRYIYHGNDGTSIPWNDTAQLNYLIPEVREAVIQTILHVARNFPIIRFDAAMTLAKKHYQRLWFPLRGLGGGVPSRAEHGMTQEEFNTVFPVEFWRDVVDRVAAEAPGTLLLAEAFWLMEGYFVRTLGMHRVYNSAFMNMLKMEENAKYRATIKNVLEFNHEILKRFVNFMNNPDEKTAVEQFGSQGKYFGACVLLATMPGLPMFGHGQIEGFHEKYGMEYKRAYWNEQIDQGLVRGHEMWIFPLLRRRWLFSGSENFVLYDFHAAEGVNEHVYAYSNMVGEHRALVLYHNRHARTAGWLKESVVFLKGGEQEGGHLERTTLAAALAVPDSAECYVSFCDQTEGLEYVRSARELHDHGLYAELGEYQFHVFLDFRIITDDSAGSWRRLHRHLGGAGAVSLDEERTQLVYPELNAAFRTLLQLLAEDQAVRAPLAADPELQQGIDLFRAAVHAEIAAAPGNTATALQKKTRRTDKVIARLMQFRNLLAQTTTGVDAHAFQLRLSAAFADPAAESLLLAWLVLRETPLEPGTYGLGYSLRPFVERPAEPEFSCRAGDLLTALLAWWRSPERNSKATALKQVQDTFTLPACRSYLQYHISEGIAWFNKERFEELFEWLALLVMLEKCAATTTATSLAKHMAETERAITGGIKLAHEAGYRSALFVSMTGKSAQARPANQKVKTEKSIKLSGKTQHT